MQSEVSPKVHCYKIRSTHSDLYYRKFDHIQDTAAARSQETLELLADNVRYTKSVLISLIRRMSGN